MPDQTAATAELEYTRDIEAPRNRRILIVDDNPAIHEDFRKIFRSSLAAPPAIDGKLVTLLQSQAVPHFRLLSSYRLYGLFHTLGEIAHRSELSMWRMDEFQYVTAERLWRD